MQGQSCREDSVTVLAKRGLPSEDVHVICVITDRVVCPGYCFPHPDIYSASYLWMCAFSKFSNYSSKFSRYLLTIVCFHLCQFKFSMFWNISVSVEDFLVKLSLRETVCTLKWVCVSHWLFWVLWLHVRLKGLLSEELVKACSLWICTPAIPLTPSNTHTRSNHRKEHVW